MDSSDITIEILKGIRDDLKGVRDDLRATNVRVDETNVRLDRLYTRQVESELRLATEIVAVASVLREVRDDLRRNNVCRDRVEDHEHRIEALEKRAG
jgi:hypothetical protein